MSHIRIGTLASACASAAVAAITIATAPAAASQTLVRLHGSSPRAAATAPRVGSVASNSTIRFQVDLELADQQGAAAFAQAVSTPGNALYGKFLTSAQWEARFSPSISTVNRVSSFLKSSGFTVGGASADRMEISASGTAQQVEHAFATSLGYYRVHGQTVRLGDRDLSVPSDIAGVVAGVSGVSQSLAQPDNTTGAAQTPSAPSATPSSNIPQPAGFRIAQPCGSYYGQKTDSTLPSYGNGYPADPPWAVCGYTPPQFRSAYSLSGTADGSGETVAIVDAYASPTLLSDAQRFASDNDPSNPLKSSQFSELLPTSFTDTHKCGASGWFGEQTLDVEAVHGTAPGANILFAGAQSCTTPGLNDALRAIVDGHLANVITNSYGDGGGDLLDSSSDRVSTDDILLMADGTGISVLFSSGDSGDEYTSVGVVTPDYPASSPYATAVGGTTLQIGSDGSRTGEFGWSTARSFLCDATWSALGGCTTSQEGTWLPIDLALDGGSGGGTSYVYPQPTYQTGVVPTSLAEANGSATPMRVEPDISMEADPATGMLVGETQTFPDGVYYDTYRIGGTSVASPLLAGVVARADETAGKPLGFLNPALYSLYGNSGALYDVGPAGNQDMSRADYVNSLDSSAGFYNTTRIIDYEGQEQFCGPTVGRSGQQVACSTRNVALSTATGYDNMTGLGSPGPGFVADLAAAGK
jgi:subtilase family serine protease